MDEIVETSFWRRHKHKVWAALAVASAGGALAYYYWGSQRKGSGVPRTKSTDQLLETIQAVINSESRPSRPMPTTASQQALEDTLEQHFVTIQTLSDKQALEDLLPRLKARLFELTDFEHIKRAIKSLSSLPHDAPTAPQDIEAQKLFHWQQLARLSLCRTVSACWLIPLLDLLVRMKLHLVGRHMYLESKLPGLRSQGLNHQRGLPPRLTERAQEEFYNSDYFIEAGAQGVVHKVMEATGRVLAGVDFTACVTPRDIEALISAMHVHFESSFEICGDSWDHFLLPPGQQPVGVVTGNGTQLVMSPSEAAMVDALNQELRDVIGNYRFVEALRSAVRFTSRVTGNYITAKFAHKPSLTRSRCHTPGEGDSRRERAMTRGTSSSGPTNSSGDSTDVKHAGSTEVEGASPPEYEPKPFAYVVPLIAKATHPLVTEPSEATRGISSLAPVGALCAFVFTCGPHLY